MQTRKDTIKAKNQPNSQVGSHPAGGLKMAISEMAIGRGAANMKG